jgi:hypothetical protein
VSRNGYYVIKGSDADENYDNLMETTYKPTIDYNDDYAKWCLNFGGRHFQSSMFYDSLDDIIRDLINSGLHTAQ